MQFLIDRPLGWIVLAVLTLGFGGFGIWQCLRAIRDPDREWPGDTARCRSRQSLELGPPERSTQAVDQSGTASSRERRRSEERRVGKECRDRRARHQMTRNKKQ